MEILNPSRVLVKAVAVVYLARHEWKNINSGSQQT